MFPIFPIKRIAGQQAVRLLYAWALSVAGVFGLHLTSFKHMKLPLEKDI